MFNCSKEPNTSCDCVPRVELWSFMWESGVKVKYVRVVQDMYEDM